MIQGIWICVISITCFVDQSILIELKPKKRKYVYFAVPPVVINQTIVFTKSDRPRTLKNNITGQPDTYTYSKWQHYTHSNQFVRVLDGQVNGTLILPNNYPDGLMYEDSGIYIYNVTNNITNEDGLLWQTGMIDVVVKGKDVYLHLFVCEK